jgi:DNA gyrase subunit A
MGVVFAKFAEDDRIIGLARNTERNLESQGADGETAEGAESEAVTDEASEPQSSQE